MKRILERGATLLLVLWFLVYGGDWAIYKLRGSPQSQVVVNQYVVIPLKGNRQEFDSLGSAPTTCSLTLFAQSGLEPCWRLRRNTNQGTKL